MFLLFLKYEFIKLLRHSWQLLAFGLIFLIGLLAIGYGKSEVAKQHAILNKIKIDQKRNIDELQLGFKADTTSDEGNLAYQKASNPAMMGWYLQLYTLNGPSAMSVFSLGLRDLFPFYLKLKPYSLYMQIFQDEISNPLKLFAGNFDLSFVIIYLFPILIIAIGYNLFSEEKEQGTLSLWITHGISAKQMLRWKLLFYYGLLCLVTFLVIAIGFWISDVQISSHFLEFFTWVVASSIYVAFWFALVFFVISFNMSTSVNAVLLSIAWLIALMVYPSSVNLLSTVVKPVKNQHLSNVIRRYTIDEGEATIKKYLHSYESRHPEYKPIDTTTHNNNMSKAYISFHEVLDEKHGKIVDSYFNAIESRVNWSERVSFLNPAVNLSKIFNSIGGTGFDTHKAFLNQTKEFHYEMKQVFHPQLFQNRMMKFDDYDQIPLFSFIPPKWSLKSILPQLAIMIFVVFGFTTFAYLNLGKTVKS